MSKYLAPKISESLVVTVVGVSVPDINVFRYIFILQSCGIVLHHVDK